MTDNSFHNLLRTRGDLPGSRYFYLDRYNQNIPFNNYFTEDTRKERIDYFQDRHLLKELHQNLEHSGPRVRSVLHKEYPTYNEHSTVNVAKGTIDAFRKFFGLLENRALNYEKRKVGNIFNSLPKPRPYKVSNELTKHLNVNKKQLTIWERFNNTGKRLKQKGMTEREVAYMAWGPSERNLEEFTFYRVKSMDLVKDRNYTRSVYNMSLDILQHNQASYVPKVKGSLSAPIINKEAIDKNLKVVKHINKNSIRKFLKEETTSEINIDTPELNTSIIINNHIQPVNYKKLDRELTRKLRHEYSNSTL